MCWKFSDEHFHHPHLKEVGVVAAAVAHQSDNMRVLPSMGFLKTRRKKFDPKLRSWQFHPKDFELLRPQVRRMVVMLHSSMPS